MAEKQNTGHLWRSHRRNIEGETQCVRVSMSEKERAQLMLLEIRGVVARVANKVDQVARHANSTGDLAAETTATVCEARQTGREVVRVMGEIKP